MKKLLVLLLLINCQLFIVNCNAQLSVSTTVIANVHCYGQSNGAVMANPTGGTPPYTYKWAPGLQTTQTINGLTAGTYTIKVKDFVGATTSATAVVSQPSALIASVSAQQTGICPGQSDSLFVTGTGGTIPYQYLWTGPLDDISCPTCARTNSYPYGAPYIVTAINDLNGCTASASVSITVHPFPYTIIQGPIDPIAPGRSDTLITLAVGATSYLWSNGNTHSSIIVSPAVSTTYSVKATNTYSCYDTAHYTIDTNSVGNGNSSGNAIRIVPSTSVITSSYSTQDSVEWFSFVPTDSNAQIIAYSAYLGFPVPHVHRLTLFNNSMQTVVDEPMPDIAGASQIRIDISHLTIGNTYYVRAARCPAHANMAGCNPSASGECNPSQRWDFQMCFRTVPVFVPDDSGAEAPSVSQLYYEHRGQITDFNGIPRFDVKAYTNNTKPAVFCTDSAVSFVYQHTDTAKSFIDTFQRVDMVLTGSSVQPSKPLFKMQEDSNAGYLNYFLGFVPNGVPKIEGYSRLVYKNVYPNVDMQVYSNSVGTKLYFVCNPAGSGIGAGNPANIELQFKGATSVSVNGSNGLDVVTELGTLSFAPGFAYTDSAGIVKAKSWQAYFVAVNSNTVKFNTGAYNSSEPLVIEVTRGHQALNSYPSQGSLDWSTYFGGTNAESDFYDVCSDDSGNVYAAGSTQSYHYPVTPGVLQDTLYDNFVNYPNATIVKFSNALSDRRVWATYYGGDLITYAYGIGLDKTGHIYITGTTDSPNLPFPFRPSSPADYIQRKLNNSALDQVNPDAFIAMLSNDGTQLYWSTYYGGAGAAEWAYHLSVDKDTDIYIVGGGVNAAINTTFPLHISSHPGSYNDSTYGTGFIVEFNATHAFDAKGIQLKWATRIGDTNHGTNKSAAILYGCTVDTRNNFYVTGVVNGYGYTSPATLTFPYKADANNYGKNAVVTRFNSNNKIIWSSYFGGNISDEGNAVTVDKIGHTYITGITSSDSSGGQIGIETKPLNNGYFQRHLGDTLSGGGFNAFIAEFDSTGGQLWGTYFGGSDNSCGKAITVDPFYNLYLTGYNYATDMPLPALNPYGVYSQLSYVSGQTLNNSFIADFATSQVVPDYNWGTYFGNDVGTGLTLTHVNGSYWLYLVGNLGNGNTPLVDTTGSYFQSPYYFAHVNTADYGTSFISLLNVDLIVGPAGASVLNSPSAGILAYPNPTRQTISVKLDLPKTGNIEIILYNIMGEEVYDKTLLQQSGTVTQNIDLSAFPNGIYLIKVIRNGTYSTQKIIKEN